MRVNRAVATAGVFLAALATGAVPAAAASDVTIKAGNGTVAAGGAALSLDLTFKCHAGWTGGVYASVVEAVGNHFASGSDGSQVTCSGGTQHKKVYLQAATGQSAQAFRAGRASVTAQVYVSDPTACDPESNDCNTLGIRPKKGPTTRLRAESDATSESATDHRTVRITS